MVVLDTTILIHLLRGEEKAVNKIASLEQKNKILYTTQINAFELIQGIYGFGKNIDDELAALETLLEGVKVLDLSHFGAYHSGKLAGQLHKKGITINSTDILIAGIALANGVSTIVTRNEKDFARIPGISVDIY